MSSRIRRILAAALTLFVCSLPLWADEGEDAEAHDENGTLEGLEEYVEVNVSALPTLNTIATKLPLSKQLTPANVGTVASPLLAEQDAVVLGDALKNISGLNIQAGPAVHDFFSIRGFDSLSSGLVLIDGASVPEASFYQLYNVAGVEVLKGPGGFLYGKDPLAGAVNIVRKQPLPTSFLNLGGSFGSHDTYEGNLDWNQASRSGNHSFRLNGVWQESDHYRDDKQSEHLAINPSYTWKMSDRSTLNFNFEYVDAEYSPDSGIPILDGEIPDVSRRRSYQSPIDFSEQDIYRFEANFETEIREGLTLRNKLYYRSLEWDSAGTLLRGTEGTEALRTLTLLDDEQRFYGNQLEAVLEFETGPIGHNLLTGVEVGRYEDEFVIDVSPPNADLPFPIGMPEIDIFDPNETFTGIGLTFNLATGDARSVIVAPYVIDQIRLTERFQLLVGARFDDIDFEDDVTSKSRDDSELSPMLGALFAFDPSLSVYANAGQSFAPPSPRLQGDVRPEESTQIEVGVKKNLLDGKLHTTLAAYKIERDDIAVTNETAFLQDPGDQEAEGIELEIAAEPLPRLRAFFSYAYNDAELTRFRLDGGPDLSGNKPPYAPEHLMTLWISKSFENGFGVGGGARYFSDQYFNADNAFEVGGAFIVDGAVFYDFEDWRFKLNLKNVTDKEYETGSFASSSVVPGTPFTAYGSFEYRF